jgi:hypothetical protein
MDWWSEARLLSEADRARESTSGVGQPTGYLESALESESIRAADALACAAWLKAMGVKELRYVGPFGEHGIRAGDRVRVMAGARVYSTMPGVPKHGKLTVRAKTVKLARVSAGKVDREGDGVVVRNPLVTWAGKGGYWCWCDANSVERVERREKPGLHVDGSIGRRTATGIGAGGSAK